jgi:catechol 2,3-dioxygenase
MTITPRDPEEATAAAVPTFGQISPATRVGAVHLTVSDLERSLGYYKSVIGLSVRERAGDRAMLGAGGEDLLVLVEQPGARPTRGYCGLYHFALLLPHRADLARWLAHAARDRVSLAGLADHYVSEAIYLSDPDGHGIEIYWDRPREVWEGKVAERMTTLPLDTSSLFGELPDPMSEPFERLPSGTVMGHVHLCVADVPQTIAFYRDVLGFALMASLGGQAAFLSAGGYHHHLGANTWESAGAGQPPAGAATLRRATIVLPNEVERDRLVGRITDADGELVAVEDGVLIYDPCGNQVALTAAVDFSQEIVTAS